MPIYNAPRNWANSSKYDEDEKSTTIIPYTGIEVDIGEENIIRSTTE